MAQLAAHNTIDSNASLRGDMFKPPGLISQLDFSA
jgi:hypothetical protein